MSAELRGRAARAFKSMAYPKFAATVDQAGVPNVVPLLSARLIEPDTIAFVRFMVWKTRRNFETNHKITFACPGPWGRSHVVKGEFVEWVTQGPLLEKVEREPIYRYNAYMGANVIGVVRIKETREYAGGGIIAPLARSIVRRLDPRPHQFLVGDEGPMAPQVIEKWARSIAVKFLAMIDENGDPVAVPHQGLIAVSNSQLSFPRPLETGNPLNQLQPGALIAASVFAPDPVAYQVKGTFEGWRQNGRRAAGTIAVSEVYSASPPVPGRRIYPSEV